MKVLFIFSLLYSFSSIAQEKKSDVCKLQDSQQVKDIVDKFADPVTGIGELQFKLSYVVWQPYRSGSYGEGKSVLVFESVDDQFQEEYSESILVHYRFLIPSKKCGEFTYSYDVQKAELINF